MYLMHCINHFLFCYRSTPQSTTGKTPEFFYKEGIQNQIVTLETEFHGEHAAETSSSTREAILE